jgi:Zn-dependent protease
VLITAFVFGFQDNEVTFVFPKWILNYLKFVILSIIALGIYICAQTYMSYKYGSKADYEVWSIGRIGFAKSSHLPMKLFGALKLNHIYLGIILPLLVSFLSDGNMYFVAVLSSIISVNPIYRLGKSFEQLTEFEEAKIALSGPLSNILMAFIIKIFEISFLNDLMLVNIFVAISYMLPFPGLDGIKVLFGSRYLYLVSILFILISSLLLNFINGTSVLIISLIISLTALLVYFYRKNKK